MGNASAEGDGEFDDRLHRASHVGDLTLVTYYVEVEKLPVDSLDGSDGTPLYYAAHGGHEDVCRFLLQSGARCDANTYQGERVFYAALNDPLRRLLRSYAVTAATPHPFRLYLSQLLGKAGCGDASAGGCDVTFAVNGEEVAAHRFVLAARCDYLRERFEAGAGPEGEAERAGDSGGHRGRWAGLDRIAVDHGAVTAEAFRGLLRWLYAGRVELPAAHVGPFRLLCRRCRLDDVLDRLPAKSDGADDGDADGEEKITEMGQLILDEGNEAVLRSYSRLAGSVLQEESESLGADVRIRLPVRAAPRSRERNPPGDAGSDSQGDVEDTVTLGLHRAVLATQSPYFAALLSGYDEDGGACMGEGSNGGGGAIMFREAAAASARGGVIDLHDMTADVFRVVVEFLYSGRLALFEDGDDDSPREEEACDPEIVCAVLEAAEVLLLPRLKALCGATLAAYITRALGPVGASRDDDDNEDSIRGERGEGSRASGDGAAGNDAAAVEQGLSVLLDGLDVALRFDLERLELHCYAAVAHHLDCILGKDSHSAIRSRFEDMVVESAWSVQERQVEDSIPLVDGVRAALAGVFRESSTEDDYVREEDGKEEADVGAGGDGEYRWRNRTIDECLARLGVATATGKARGANTGVLASRTKTVC